MVTDLKVIDKDEINWSLEKKRYVEHFEYVTISGDSKTQVDEFKLELKATDTLGRVQTYDISKVAGQENTIIKKIR